jgi:membrane glycosyltransferase
MTHPNHPAKVVNLGRLRHSGSRQAFFFTVVLTLTGLATWVMADILWRGGLDGIEIAMLILFIPLFGMVTLGFTQAVFGFFILLRRKNPCSISRTLPDKLPAMSTLPATAIAIPIYNEDVSRVYEGIRTIYLDLVRTGYIERFDIFILSDSNNPNKWIEEEVAWIDLCKQVKGFGRIFYRKRNIALNRKSGNISDFLRRWGRKYRYMVVLDADSLMEGNTLARMVQMMEVNPTVGIIQTVPSPIQGETFFARLMQFSGVLYGPVFQAGLNYWQAGSGNFWGHNAIIRVAPFIDHCALPTLRASPGGGGSRFMSHDYVEAALMRRANYEVWMAYELGGSYENLPPTLVDHACRDRRWCRGNLQHSWLLSAKGFRPINRLHLALGILSYLASPLWFIFMILGTIQCQLYWAAGAPPRFDSDIGLSSFLDIGGGRLALILFIVTIVMLTLPKVLAVLLTMFNRRRRMAFGGSTGITRISSGTFLFRSDGTNPNVLQCPLCHGNHDGTRCPLESPVTGCRKQCRLGWNFQGTRRTNRGWRDLGHDRTANQSRLFLVAKPRNFRPDGLHPHLGAPEHASRWKSAAPHETVSHSGREPSSFGRETS